MKVRLVNCDGHREAKCVNHNVFLAPLNLLVPINALAGRVCMVGCLHASGVNDSHAGALIPTYKLAGKGMQCIHDIFKHALKLPLPEVIIDGLPRTELSREKSPLAACLVDVKDSVHDVTK